MRTIKELLQVMLDNKHLFKSGLCCWVDLLWAYDLINYKEHVILSEYINENIPIIGKVRMFFSRDSYYWESGNIKPRIKWLKKHINKN